MIQIEGCKATLFNRISLRKLHLQEFRFKEFNLTERWTGAERLVAQSENVAQKFAQFDQSNPIVSQLREIFWDICAGN